MAHDDEREQGYDNGGVAPDGVITVTAFVVVLVSDLFGIAFALRVAGVLHALDMLSNSIGPIGRRRQMIVDKGGEK